jgi:hypothetical protein
VSGLNRPSTTVMLLARTCKKIARCASARDTEVPGANPINSVSLVSTGYVRSNPVFKVDGLITNMVVDLDGPTSSEYNMFISNLQSLIRYILHF